MHVIYSRQPLIKKALGGFKTDLVDEKTIAALKEKPMVTLEHFQRAMEGGLASPALISITTRKSSPLNWARRGG